MRLFIAAAIAACATRSILVPLMGSVATVGTLTVLFVGGGRVIDGRLTVGDFVAFTTTLAILSWPSIALGWILNALQRGLAASDRLEEIFSEVPEVADDARLETDFEVAGPIELRSVTFSHAGSDRPAVQDVSFRIPPGGRLGIVGPTGSGKSTLVALLTRLYDAPPRTIFLDGKAIEEISRSELRNWIGVVPQETFLFSDTIAENIRFGRSDASDADVADIRSFARVGDIWRGAESSALDRGIAGCWRKRACIGAGWIAEFERKSWV